MGSPASDSNLQLGEIIANQKTTWCCVGEIGHNRRGKPIIGFLKLSRTQNYWELTGRVVGDIPTGVQQGVLTINEGEVIFNHPQIIFKDLIYIPTATGRSLVFRDQVYIELKLCGEINPNIRSVVWVMQSLFTDEIPKHRHAKYQSFRLTRYGERSQYWITRQLSYPSVENGTTVPTYLVCPMGGESVIPMSELLIRP